MLRGPLIFIGPLPVERAPDIQKDYLLMTTLSLIVTGALFFWRAQMVRGAPTALTCFFVGFRTDFVAYVRGSVASA